MQLKFLKSSGLSLPELTVAMGITAAISLVSIKIIQEQSANESFLKSRMEINQTVSILKGAMGKPSNCQDMIGAVIPTTAGTAIPVLKINVSTIPLVQKIFLSAPIAAGTYTSYGAFYLEPNGIRLATSSLGISVVELVIDFKHKKRSLFQRGGYNAADRAKDSILTYKIPVVVKLNGAGQVDSCGPVLSDANSSAHEKMCNTLIAGGMATWDGSVCRLNSMDCPFGKIPDRLVGIGTPTCVDMETKMNMYDLFSETESTCTLGTSFWIEQISGKLQLRCN